VPTPIVIKYPLDPTGQNPNNLVAGEEHALSARPIRCIATKYGGYFANSMVIKDLATNLILNSSQWYPSELYEVPTALYGQPVYALIVITDTTVSNLVSISYQAVGGEFSTSETALINLIDTLELDNRPVTWPNILLKPTDYPPSQHLHNAGDIYGFEYVTHALERIRSTIEFGSAISNDKILRYLDGQIANESTDTQNALDLKASLNSPALTGTPTAPTAAVSTNTTQVATTAYVNAEIANDAPSKTGTGASGTWGISVTGNAATATALATTHSITASGDATWSVNFNGSAHASAALTLANSGVTAGTYRSVTVNAKGLVTAGTNPTTISGYGITDAYTKTEIDSQLQGLKPKASVLAASTANITLNTATATLDGVALVAGSRVLLKNQTTASQNGIYTDLTTAIWKRATDADIASELVSAFVFVEQGTVHKDSAWVQTADNIVLGTTALTWIQFAGSGAYATVAHTHDLTGEVTSVGNTTTVTNAAVIGKVLTGYASGAGAVAATDTILQAINKLNGNDGLKANIADTYTKAEIDSQLQGLKPKASVLAASTANIALNTATATLDGVTLAAGSRVLLKNQTTASQNGIYTDLTTAIWKRAIDADVNSELVSAFVFVEQGTANKDSAWVQTADNIVLGTTNLIWVQFAGSGAYQSVVTGAASSITGSDLTVSRSLVSDSNGKVAVSTVTSTELGYLTGVTSAIQTQIGTKANLNSPALTGTPTAPTAAVNTNTTQVATTAYVNAEIANDAPSKTGTGASGTWGISVTGNAATATNLATARSINGISFDGSADITINAVDSTARIASSEKGVANGVATLDSSGKVPTGQLSIVSDNTKANLSGAEFTGPISSLAAMPATDWNLVRRTGWYVVNGLSAATNGPADGWYKGYCNAYTNIWLTQEVWGFAVNNNTIATGNTPESIVTSSDNKHVYVSSRGSSTISMYSRDITTGVLTSIGTVASGGLSVYETLISPTGNHVYVIDSYNIYQYSRNTTTGILTALTPASVSTNGAAFAGAISSDGNHIYTTNSSNNTIRIFSRNTTTGALTDLGTMDNGSTSYGITVSPDNKHVYVSNGLNGIANTISQYSRDTTTGVLTPLSPATITTTDPWRLVVSPDGKHLYVINRNIHSISRYTRSTTTGLLTSIITHAPVTMAVGKLPWDLTVSPDSKHVYVANYSDNTVSQYSRHIAYGVLTHIADIGTDNGPSSLAFTQDGTNLYVTNLIDRTISQFSRSDTSTTGDLTTVVASAGSSDSKRYRRERNNGVWSNWEQIYDTSDELADILSEPIESPAFTGIPTAPTALSTDNSTQIATTAYVKSLGFATTSGVTQVTATAPVMSSGGTAPIISMAAATTSSNGYMTSAQATKLEATYTKTEIDSQLQGLKPKASVLAASTANITLNTATATLDGVALVAGSRVLLKNQTTASQNGIYTDLTTAIWKRATDADIASELVSAFVFVEQGTVNKDSAWVQTADNIVLGTTNLIWVQFAGSGAYQSIITGGATTITGSDLTASRSLVSDVNGKVAVSAVTSTELGYLTGVTSAIQTQIGTKANLASPIFTGNVTGLGIATGTSFNSITGLSSTNPAAAGTVGPGSLFTAARADHVHPAQTTITGNAATVTTNANLTGEVTSVGNATTVTNAAVIGKVLTGYVSAAGAVAATDTILQAVNKLNGNIGTKANLASPTFTGTVSGITSAMVGALPLTGGTLTGGLIIEVPAPGNAYIELGRIDGAVSTPYIDFHSSSTGLDYDSRIIASGGDGSLGKGKGTLSFMAATAAFEGVITGTSFNSITGLSSTNPAAAGTVGPGSLFTAARADHVHPAQTTISGNAATATSAASCTGNAATVTNGVYTNTINYGTVINWRYASYTTVLSDGASVGTPTVMIIMDTGGIPDATVTIPANASVAYPVGATMQITRISQSGKVRIVPASGVVINSLGGFKSIPWNGAVTLIQISTNNWILVGALTE